jgi:hypothetical protein
MAPIASIIPELIKNAMPAPVPQMSWESGFIQDFFHNWKLGRLEKASEREANISQNKHRDVKAKLDTIHEVITFSKRMETSLKQYNHQMAMMDIEEDKAKAELIQVQLKNMLLQGEVKLNEVELKIKMKEMEEILGGQNV